MMYDLGIWFSVLMTIGRIPIYILIDRSGNNEWDQRVERFIHRLAGTLKQDAFMLEVTHVSVIGYGSQSPMFTSAAPRQLLPMTSILDFDYRHLPRYESPLGSAFQELYNCVYEEHDPATKNGSDDGKPFLFILLVNQPTDKWEQSAKVLTEIFSCGNVFIIIDNDSLKNVSESIVRQFLSGHELAGYKMPMPIFNVDPSPDEFFRTFANSFTWYFDPPFSSEPSICNAEDFFLPPPPSEIDIEF